ncbi:MAG: pyruvate kinase [Firmicutes bacterium]|nr:pyruvate kinase [Bacillota bacterium]
MRTKQTQIICTIGPASNKEDTIAQMARVGMNIARVNCSHGGAEGNRHVFEVLKKTREKHGLDFKIMLDTKGPDVRIGTFKEGGVDLKSGDIFTLTTDECEGTKNRVWINCPPLPKKVAVGQPILLSDGMIHVVVTEVKGNDVITKIEIGGRLTDRKTAFAPNCDLGLPFMADYDKHDLILGKKYGAELVAASFVGNGADLDEMNEFMRKNKCEMPIISKIESSDGIKNLDEILQRTWGIMVARGDLGVEYPIEQIPTLQKLIVTKTREVGKFCVVATEMMESMVSRPRPTRAEVTDVANAVWQDASAVMLSAESATGNFPVETVTYMSKIVMEAEKSKTN